MPNPVPEKRVGLALLIIGGFSLFMYVANTYATQSTDIFACLTILVLLGLGWFLRQRFRGWGLPPRPPAGGKPGGGGRPPAPRGGVPAPSGKKSLPGPPAGAKPAGSPSGPPAAPKPKGFLGQLNEAFKPKNKK